MNMKKERIYGILCIVLSLLGFLAFIENETFAYIGVFFLLFQPMIILIANSNLKTKVWYKTAVIVLAASSVLVLLALGIRTFVYIPNYMEPSFGRGLIYMFGEITFVLWCIISLIVLFECIFSYRRKRSSLAVISVSKRAKITAVFCVIGVFLTVVMSIAAYRFLTPETIKIRGEKYLVGDEYYYTLNKETNTVTLNQIIDPKQESIIIPDNIDGYSVDAIGTVADKPVLYMPKRLGLFEGNKYIKTVIVPDSINHLEYDTFKQSTVERVTFEGDINKISQGTFSDCEYLEEVIFKGNVSIIGNYAFSYTKLKEITLPDGVEKIEFGSFWHNKSLEKIVIWDKVKYIEDNAFDDCPNLTIYGIKNSYAEKYANEHNIPFKELVR